VDHQGLIKWHEIRKKKSVTKLIIAIKIKRVKQS